MAHAINLLSIPLFVRNGIFPFRTLGKKLLGENVWEEYFLRY